MQDSAPLNQQTSHGAALSLSNRLRAWGVHLNFWELGALSWWPVLWGQKKPFICTPKQELMPTRQSVYAANLIAMPKVLLMLNMTTAIIVSPFSALYSPLLFGCAMMLCILKIWAAKVMLDNYGYEHISALKKGAVNKGAVNKSTVNKVVAVNPFVAKEPSQLRRTGMVKSKDNSSVSTFKDDSAVNF